MKKQKLFLILGLLSISIMLSGCSLLKSFSNPSIATYKNESIDYNTEMKNYLIGEPKYLELFLCKYKIPVYQFKDAKKAAQKLSAAIKVMSNDNYKPYYLELEGHWFSESEYKLTNDVTNIMYVGDLKDNQPNGLGIIFEPDPDGENPMPSIKYIGYFKKGLFDGYGRVYHIPTNEDDEDYLASVMYPDVKDAVNKRLNYLEYEGIFKKGKMIGKGNQFHYTTMRMESDLGIEPSISVTIGTFKDGKINGKGKSYYSGYLLYSGSYKDGKFDGKGTLYFQESNKVQYKGEFSSDKYDGKGTLYDESGKEVYSGEWNYGDYK